MCFVSSWTCVYDEQMNWNAPNEWKLQSMNEWMSIKLFIICFFGGSLKTQVRFFPLLHMSSHLSPHKAFLIDLLLLLLLGAQNPLSYYIYLYNILGFVRLWRCPVTLSIHPFRHPSRHSSRHPSFHLSRWRPSVLAFPWCLTLSLHLRPLVLAFPWCLTCRRIHHKINFKKKN